LFYRLKEKARLILAGQKKLRETFKNDEHLRVITHNSGPIFSFVGKDINAIAMAELMKKRKWRVACI